MEAKKRLRDENADIPLTPRDWQSETADMTANEIEGMTIKAKRPLLKQTFLKRAEELGCIASYQPFADRVLSLKTLKVGPQSSVAVLPEPFWSTRSRTSVKSLSNMPVFSNFLH